MQGLGQGGLASVARVLPLTSCLRLAVCSSPVSILAAGSPAHTACHHSSIQLSFSEALSALVASTMGNAGGTLSGEGRQQQGMGKVVIFHPSPPHKVGEPIFQDFEITTVFVAE